MNRCLDLFFTFGRIGACTFGGGYAMLPLLQRELVENKGWATQADLADYYAVGQCTPGIIAVNTATFVGYYRAGVPGGIAATLGLVAPSVLIIALIAAFLTGFNHIPAVAHAFVGLRACVCALILHSSLKLLKGAVVDVPTGLLYCAALLGSAWLGLSPVVLVPIAGLCGLAIRKMRGWQR